MDDNIALQTTKQPNREKTENSRQPYSKPHLDELGDLRTFTLGASGKLGDWSGGNQKEKRYYPSVMK